MLSLGWALIQYDWYLYKKRSGHRHIQREDNVKTEKMAIYKPRRKASEKNHLCPYFVLRLLDSRARQKQISVG